MIIQSPSLGNIFSLKGDLETTTAHAKAHCVHVYVIFLGGCLGIDIFWIEAAGEGDGRVMEWTGGVCVVEDGDVDGYFAASTGTDVGCKGAETGVSVYYFVWNEEGACGWTGWGGGWIGEVFAA